MAFKIIDKRYGVYTDTDICTFVADWIRDVYTLPECSAGSICICTENHSEYMLGADCKWHKIKTYTCEADPPIVEGGHDVTIHLCCYNDWLTYGDPNYPDVKYSIDGGVTWTPVTSEYVTVQTPQIAIDKSGCLGNIATDNCYGSVEIEEKETISVSEDMTIHVYISY